MRIGGYQGQCDFNWPIYSTYMYDDEVNLLGKRLSRLLTPG